MLFRSDLEARSHYSRRALQYAFPARLDCTPKQWIRRQRLNLAMEQLRQGEGHTSIRQLAHACGFPDPGNFSRAFQEQFGLMPSQVRRRAL